MQIFTFQRRSCKLSFLLLPQSQSASESLLARVIYRESKIGNDLGGGGGGGGMVDFTGPKVPIEWLNFTAAQSAKMSNSGTQDDSPVWGTKNQTGN